MENLENFSQSGEGSRKNEQERKISDLITPEMWEEYKKKFGDREATAVWFNAEHQSYNRVPLSAEVGSDDLPLYLAPYHATQDEEDNGVLIHNGPSSVK